MRFSKSLAVCLFALAAPAHAACDLCDEVVELDDHGVGCLQGLLAQRLPPPDVPGPETYSLEACGADASGGRGGLLTMPRLIEGDVPRQSAQVVFALDHRFAVCLQALLEQVSRPVETTVTFDLFELCDG